MQIFVLKKKEKKKKTKKKAIELLSNFLDSTSPMFNL
jgi:hypothetical protein